MTKNDENGDIAVGVIEERIVYLQGRYANTARNHGRFSPDALTLSSRLSEASDILTRVKQALVEEGKIQPLPAGADLSGLYEAVEHFKEELQKACLGVPEDLRKDAEKNAPAVDAPYTSEREEYNVRFAASLETLDSIDSEIKKKIGLSKPYPEDLVFIRNQINTIYTHLVSLRQAFFVLFDNSIPQVAGSDTTPRVTLEDIHTVVGEEIRKALAEHRQWNTVFDSRAREHHVGGWGGGSFGGVGAALEDTVKNPGATKVNIINKTDAKVEVEDPIDDDSRDPRALYESILTDLDSLESLFTVYSVDSVSASKLGNLSRMIKRQVKELYYITKGTEE